MNKTIIAVVDDMFFAAKIRATAEALGVTIVFPRSKQSLFEKLAEATPALVLVDLHNQKLDPLDLARELKASTQNIPLLGFFSHVETELQRNAMAAGFDRVIARSVFSRDLADILAD
jgi:CheY-like chemotaxis protein